MLPVEVDDAMAQLLTEGYALKEILLGLAVRELFVSSAGRELGAFVDDTKLVLRATKRICGGQDRANALDRRLMEILGPIDTRPAG